MSILLYLIFSLLIIVNLSLFYCDLRIKWIEVISVLFIILLLGGNTFNADFDDYLSMYNTGLYPLLIEPGFEYVSTFFASLGFDFIAYRFVCYAVIFFIIWLSTRRIVNSYHLLLFVYLSYSAIIDAIQLRNTLAISFLLAAIFLLAKVKPWWFVGMIMLACVFHYTSIFFLPLFLYKELIPIIEKYKVYLIVFSLGMCAFTFITGFFMQDLIELIILLMNERKADYIVMSATNVAFIIFPYTTFFIVSYARKVIESQLDETDNEQLVIIRYVDIIYFASVLFILISPLLIYSHDFLRIVRDLNIGITVLITLFFFVYRNSSSELEERDLVWHKEFVISLWLYFALWFVGGQYLPGYQELMDNNVVCDIVDGIEPDVVDDM